MTESLRVATARDENPPFLVRTFVTVGKLHRMNVYDGPRPISDEHQIFTWKDATSKEVPPHSTIHLSDLTTFSRILASLALPNIERYGVDPFPTAPDGQTAFRLARDNGHIGVAGYPIATNIGKLLTGSYILVYTMILFLDLPNDTEKMKQFSHFIIWKVPRSVFWNLTKIVAWELSKVLLSILKELGKWIWKVIFVDTPRVLKHLSHWIWEMVTPIPFIFLIVNAAQTIVSVICTATLATVSFFRFVTPRNVWNDSVTIFDTFFVDIPLLLLQGSERAWTISDYKMRGISNTF
ncbi:hypothetical protein DL96DRAFT_1820817 [Flagelloscypha sp. PMI_526]|nr:hypothetical protein DL96DRAFT_1820817 [Flagelloscypha sp. PMI_526]